MKLEGVELNGKIDGIEIGTIKPYSSNSVIYTQRVSRVNNAVKFTLTCDTKVDHPKGEWLASVPNAFKPRSDQYIIGYGASAKRAYLFLVSNSGYLQPVETIPSDSWYFDGIYFIN